jgi:hypothetical protein
MLEGMAQPVKFGDDELITGAVGRVQCLVQLGSAGEFAAGFVKEHFVAAGREQGVLLGFGVLFAGRDRP